MIFNTYSNLVGKHSFLSPSKYHWINYDLDKLDRVYMASLAARRGVELHELAHDLIRLGVRLPDEPKTLNLYVNDAIDYKLSPEQTLFYSEHSFGTADSIGFWRDKLRISDLKTGENPGSVHQLEVYAGLFCLEYGFKPFEIQMELRLYQTDEVQIFEPLPGDIVHIMDKIVTFDQHIKSIRMGVS